MTGAAGMLAGVTIFRIVAASNMTANAAQAQMHPSVACCQAFHATIAGGHDPPDGIQMRAYRMPPPHCPLAPK
jgi:hypothetical protein